jgi:UDP-N-acetyl-D-galactosamine dehydrogenase
VILAVSHKWYLELGQTGIQSMIRDGGVLVDIKSVLDPARTVRRIRYWSV